MIEIRKINEVRRQMNSHENKNKFESNKKYFTISVYTVCVVLVSTIGIRAIFNWKETTSFLSILIRKLSPFLAGAFMAYVLLPLVKYLEKNIFSAYFKIRSKKYCRFFSILTTYLLVIGLIILFFIFIIPQLAKSIYDLISALPSTEEMKGWLNALESHFPNFDWALVEGPLNEALPGMLSKVTSLLTNLIPLVYTASVSIVQWLINLIISIIISCYVLSDSKILARNCKKLLHVLLPQSKYYSLMKTLDECNHIFGGFIIGKLIDSLIIGTICLIVLSIARFPFAVLISVIVGVTNMIPYFGPFIGAIPGFFIILIVNPKQAFIFLFIILVIQQFDGLYLGPKILGDSTGLRPLWIIFAITAGGWAAGPVGMFLGVPCVAVIAYLMNRFLDRKLTEKGIILPDNEK